MKLLYLSCHSILEYDELKLFEELGIEYFSLGSYIDPQNPVDPIRPALTQPVDQELLKVAPDRNHIPKEFFDKFDVIVVMHIPEWIYDNWENMKHKTVIWRSIGQSTPAIEAKMWHYRQQGLKIVRYSPYEAYIPQTAGADAVIRFYKDPDEFKGYTGVQKQAITVAQDMKNRGEHCNYDAFLKLIEGLPAKLYGNRNEASGELNGGFLTYEGMKQIMRDNRVYIYTGTQPASYVLNFIEALMTGIPIVALGDKYGNSLNIAGQTYEVHTIINNAVNGFVSNDMVKLREYVTRLLEDDKLAKRIGAMGRETAIKLFGKQTIKAQWANFLGLTNTKQS